MQIAGGGDLEAETLGARGGQRRNCCHGALVAEASPWRPLDALIALIALWPLQRPCIHPGGAVVDVQIAGSDHAKRKALRARDWQRCHCRHGALVAEAVPRRALIALIALVTLRTLQRACIDPGGAAVDVHIAGSDHAKRKALRARGGQRRNCRHGALVAETSPWVPLDALIALIALVTLRTLQRAGVHPGKAVEDVQIAGGGDLEAETLRAGDRQITHGGYRAAIAEAGPWRPLDAGITNGPLDVIKCHQRDPAGCTHQAPLDLGGRFPQLHRCPRGACEIGEQHQRRPGGCAN